MFRLLNIVWLLSIFCVSWANEEPPKVTIAQGQMQGGVGQTQKNRPYYYFTRIPYAKPPVGQYRFEPPASPKPWNDTFDATQASPICIQFENSHYSNIIGSEDCLYLNVYTPQLPNEDGKLLPVMFYIGGEKFEFDDTTKEKFGPELLLDKDIVLVTINYRLGPFGFFITEQDIVKYNIGLRDQQFALKWVHKNIAQFGGDPNKITLFGNGAGGASAHFHMLSPMSKNLVNGVIAQSGTAFNIWSFMPVPTSGIYSRALGGLAKCPTEHKDKRMIECLKYVEAKDFLNATMQLKKDGRINLFKPVLDRDENDSFLPSDPIDIIKKKQFAQVPFMSGITTEDGAYYAEQILNSPPKLEEFNSNFEEIGSSLLYYGVTAIVKNRIPISKKIKQFYFKDYTINEATRKELTNMYTDGIFLEGLMLATKALISHTEKPVYNYLFGYKGSKSYTKSLNKRKEVCHKDELLYLFKNQIDFPDYIPTESDAKMTELMVTLWTNFATYGNPTPPEDSSLSFTWKPVAKKESNYLFIKPNGEPEIRKKMLPKRSDFWMNLVLDSRRERVRDEL